RQLNLGVVEDARQIAGQNAFGQLVVAWLFDIADDDRIDPERSPRVASRAVAVVDQQPGHAGSHGSHADQSDFRDLHGKAWRNRRLWRNGNADAGRKSRCAHAICTRQEASSGCESPICSCAPRERTLRPVHSLGSPAREEPAVAIAVECAQCGKQLKVKDELAGRKGKCPQCQTTIQIPSVGPVPIAVEQGGAKGGTATVTLAAAKTQTVAAGVRSQESGDRGQGAGTQTAAAAPAAKAAPQSYEQVREAVLAAFSGKMTPPKV